MSSRLFAIEIQRFLQSRSPEVLCITGKWGVGKTFAWNAFLKKAQEADQVALDKYAYVSLFGRNSLEDLRTAIVESTVDSRKIGDGPSLDTFIDSLGKLKSLTGSVGRWAGLLPITSNHVGNINRALFMMLKDQIICLDDMERAGQGLSVRNVLGLASLLKEEKNCKVVILLNRDALNGDAEEDFRKQLEKVADTIAVYEPTPKEAAQLAIPTNEGFPGLLRKNVCTLGIVNIRTIKKAQTLCERASQLLLGRDERLLTQAVHTIPLAVFAKLEPDAAPPMSIIRSFDSFREYFVSHVRKAEIDPDASHKTALRNYNFTSIDEFDLALINGVERGFFDPDEIGQQADKKERELRNADQNNELERAWSLYHSSFDDNQKEVVGAMLFALQTGAEAITPINLSGSIAFLKEAGRAAEAAEALRHYVDIRQEAHSFWDLKTHPFGSQIADPDVRSAFEAKFKSVAVAPDPRETLLRCSEQNGWNPEDLSILSALTPKELGAMFKTMRGSILDKAITFGLGFRDFGNASTEMQTFGGNVESALRLIGAESWLNTRRLTKYGILPS